MKAFGQLEGLLNGTGDREVADDLWDALWHMHPTLEQKFWKTVYAVAKRNAALEDRFYDARNEASHAFCKKVAALDAYFPFI